MIKKVKFEHFKGQTEEVELTGRDLFIGENGTGKTTIQQAIALAIQGHLPGGFKTAEDVFQYATGQSMSVGICTEAGFEVKRTWTQTQTVDRKTGATGAKISQTIMVWPSNGETTNTEKEQRIAAEIGSIPLMFDFGELDGMTDGKRRDFIYQIADFDRSKYGRSYIEGYLLQKAAEIEEVEFRQTALKAINDTMEKYPASSKFEEALEALQAYTYAKEVEFKTTRMEATAAGKKLLDYKNEINSTAKGIQEAKAEEQALNDKIEEYAGLASKQRENAAEKGRLEAEAARLESLAEEQARTLAEAKNAAEGLRARLSGEINNTEEPPVDLQKELEETAHNINQAQEMLKELEKLRNDASVTVTLEEEKAQIMAEGRCPVTDDWQCPFDWKGKGKQAEDARDRAFDEYKKFDARWQEISAQLNKDRNKEQLLKTRIWEIKNNQADAERKREEQAFRLKAAESSVQLHEETLAKYKDRLAETEIRIKEIGRVDQDATEKTAMLLEGYRNQRADKRAEIEQKTKAMSALEAMLKATEEARQAEILFGIYHDIHIQLGPKGVQGAIVKDIVAPIEQDITKRLQAIPKYKDHEFRFITESDTGKEVFRYGWKDQKDNIVLYPALSTSEKAILAAAILTTLIQSMSIGTRIFMADNIENFDSAARAAFLRAILTMAGSFDNILAAGVLTEEEARAAEEEGFRTWITN